MLPSAVSFIIMAYVDRKFIQMTNFRARDRRICPKHKHMHQIGLN